MVTKFEGYNDVARSQVACDLIIHDTRYNTGTVPTRPVPRAGERSTCGDAEPERMVPRFPLRSEYRIRGCPSDDYFPISHGTSHPACSGEGCLYRKEVGLAFLNT